MVAGGMAQDVESKVLAANRDGMDSLKKGQTKAAFDQFKFAETTLNAQEGGEFQHLLAVTCNNLGSYYKKVGKLHGALSYLRRALKMEIDLGTDAGTVAGTHLNICAILSKLEKHDKALQHALDALDLVSGLVEGKAPEDASQDDYQILAIAYHNVAVERDFLQQYDKAAATFQKGFNVAKKYLGEDHSLTITLGNNCDNMASKSQKLSGKRPPGAPATPRRPPPPSAVPASPRAPGPTTTLPALPPSVTMRPNEEKGVIPFSQTMLGKSPALPPVPGASGGVPAQALDLTMQPAKPRVLAPVSALYHNDHNDVINAANTGHEVGKSSKASKDFRPHRMVGGATRTAKLTRRTLGASIETANRDKLLAKKDQEFKGLAAAKDAYLRKMAAERIQRYWRAYRVYCKENAEWMTTTWVAATVISVHWRSFWVRRKERHRAATTIQRIMRGIQARQYLKRKSAATFIQTHARGYIIRERMKLKRRSALKMTALARGFLGRCRARAKRRHLTEVAIKLQCFQRCCIARRRVREMRATRDDERATRKAATDIQRLFRGKKGRQQFQQTRQKYLRDAEEYRAATRIQAQVRRKSAAARVKGLRESRRQQMDSAAAFMQKIWKGHKSRRRYLDLMRQFKKQEKHVITAQRYARGFLVRLRMWREAITAEEELWASLEIQRVWRGYCGRVEWESKYEDVWRRELSAALIQRYMRGFLARTAVARMRRKIARAEFERARLRFRSAQQIQAMARKMIVSIKFQQRFARARAAATCIQRMARGWLLRRRLWQQVMEVRATVIQANVRGWLVRRRRRKTFAKVILIQRAYREWRRLPVHVRAEAARKREDKKQKARLIQRRYRSRLESREVTRIQALPAKEAAPGS